MRLVDEQQVVVGEEAVERVGRRARRTAAQGPAVVFDSRAIAHFGHHLQIEPGAGIEPLGLEQFALAAEQFEPLFELVLDRADRAGDPFLRQHKVLRRIDVEFFLLLNRFAAGGMDQRQLLDFVTPKLDPHRVFFVGRPELDAIAPHAKLAAGEFHVVALVLHVDQLPQHLVAVDLHPAPQADHHRLVIHRRAQAVNARHAGDDDHVAATDQRTRGC